MLCARFVTPVAPRCSSTPNSRSVSIGHRSVLFLGVLLLLRQTGRAVDLVRLERAIVERQSMELEVLYCRDFAQNALLHVSGFVAEWASESDAHFVALYSQKRVSSLQNTIESLRLEHFMQRRRVDEALLTGSPLTFGN